MVWKNSNNTMKAAASFFVKLLLGFAASSAVASAFVTVVPPKIITTHQTHHQPESSTKLAAQNQSHFHQLSSWLSSPTIAAAPIISAATIFALTVVTSYPSPATAAGDVTKGSQIFTSTCAGCHAGGNNFIKEKKTLKKDALEKYVGLEETKITEFFKKSFVHQNQAGGGKMSEEDVADVISYVITQAVDDKW
jgi:cytochrome c6